MSVQALLLSQKGGGAKGFTPIYSGESKIVMSEDGKSGYIECYTSGSLTWLDGKFPETVDITCVGAGGGGSAAYSYSTQVYRAGSGGGGGYVVNKTGVAMTSSVMDIFIGLGGNQSAQGGTTIVGSLCSADGGTGASGSDNKTTAGSGGNAGGLGHVKQNTLEYQDTAGSSNGVSPSASGNSYQTAGTSQGTETKDIFGRRHAGGGSGGIIWYNDTPLAGGATDYDLNAGANGGDAKEAVVTSSTIVPGGKGGGGAGGGGGGGSAGRSDPMTVGKGAGGKGGDGLAIIAWGDYLAVYAQEVA